MTSTKPPAAGCSQPPADTFWTRYSPNGEAVVSPLASALLHAVVLGVLLLGVLAIFRGQPEPITLEPATLGGDGREEGDGGTPFGQGHNRSYSGPQDPAANVKPERPVTAGPPDGDAAVTRPAAPVVPDGDEPVARTREPRRQDPTIGQFLKNRFPGPQGKGVDGPGAGRRKGDGTGTGPKGPRDERQMRWELLFRADSHADYLRQLNALGAFIGVADPAGNLLVIKNLSERPARPVPDTVRDLNRIYWVDSRPDSARGIAELLQLNLVPDAFVAFIPVAVEDELLRVELAYAKKHYNVTDEKRIQATQFQVSFRGGKPQFTVKSQTYK